MIEVEICNKVLKQVLGYVKCFGFDPKLISFSNSKQLSPQHEVKLE